jgi:hypothetical protein
VRARLAAARRLGVDVVTTSPVIGQVWRDGRRQALVARLITATHVRAPDTAAAKRAGALLAAAAVDDIVDALVAELARDGDLVLTSDPDDLQALLRAGRIVATVLPV